MFNSVKFCRILIGISHGVLFHFILKQLFQEPPPLNALSAQLEQEKSVLSNAFHAIIPSPPLSVTLFAPGPLSCASCIKCGWLKRPSTRTFIQLTILTL